MARKRRRAMKKDVNAEENYDRHGKCNCKYFLVKITAMAFILFLVTVWPVVGNWLLGVPWWVYLIITVVFGAGACMKNCWCCKK